MFADPISFNAEGSARNFVKVGEANGLSTYKWSGSTGDFDVVIKQNTTKERFRREIRVSHTTVAEDPISSVNKSIGASVYIVVDEPKFGYVDADLLGFVQNLATFVTTSSGANTSKLLLGER